jgi:hypothetical protein
MEGVGVGERLIIRFQACRFPSLAKEGWRRDQ